MPRHRAGTRRPLGPLVATSRRYRCCVCRAGPVIACRIVQNYEGKFEADRHEMAQVQRPLIHAQFMHASNRAWAVNGAARTLAKPPRGPQHTAIRLLCILLPHCGVVARPVGRVQYITMNEKVHELQREVLQCSGPAIRSTRPTSGPPRHMRCDKETTAAAGAGGRAAAAECRPAGHDQLPGEGKPAAAAAAARAATLRDLSYRCR